MGGGGVAGIDDGVPPFHTLVGPGQFLRHTSVEAEQPGGECIVILGWAVPLVVLL